MSPREFEKVLARDGGHCLHCGATETLVPHHRKNRKMGGSRRLEVPSNVIVTCASLNSLMESDPETQRWARERGWKLRDHQDPLTTPVQDNTTNSMWLLHDDHTLIEYRDPLIDDALFRMIQPHEQMWGMDFPRDYTILGTKSERTLQAGNAVTPPSARDIGTICAETLVA